MKTIEELSDLMRGQTVLIRVDFNVPLDKETHEITNDRRIRQALPTVRHALDMDAKVICMSHLGRPTGERKPELSMEKVANRFSELLDRPVKFAPDCIGPEVERMSNRLEGGEVMLLENLRFHSGEKENDPAFAEQLASLADCYINDAFGTAHRAHASTAGVPRHLPGGIGFLIQKEIEYLSKVLGNPQKPYVCIMGGAKVSDKISAIRNLMKPATDLLIGGAMAYTFLKQQGVPVGNSLVEEDKLDLAEELLAEGEDKIRLPRDHVCAEQIDADAPVQVTDNEIPDGQIGLDIGPKTADEYAEKIRDAKMVTWNGPLGYFEIEAFAEGTRKIARAIAECKGLTIIGGGETAESIERLGLQDQVSHVSTGGGACLEFLSGKQLPALTALEEGPQHA
mgnify:CR=1 FL=1